jgi:hypothetical protein
VQALGSKGASGGFTDVGAVSVEACDSTPDETGASLDDDDELLPDELLPDEPFPDEDVALPLTVELEPVTTVTSAPLLVE